MSSVLSRQLNEAILSLEWLFRELTDEQWERYMRFRKLVKKLSPAAPRRAGARESVRRFVHARLRQCDGACVTSAKLVRAYRAFCREQGLPVASDQRAARDLAAAIRERFGFEGCNTVKSGGRKVRGYEGIRLAAGRAGS